MTRPPVVARFLKSKGVEIPGAAEFSLIGGEDEQLHASLPELAEVSMISLTRTIERLGEAIDDPYLKIYFYDQGPTFNPEVSPRAPFTLEIRGDGRMAVAAQLNLDNPEYEMYPQLHLLVAPLLKRHGAAPTRGARYDEWGKIRIYLEFEYSSLRGVRVRDAYRLAGEVRALASAIARRGQFDATVVAALITSGQADALLGQQEHQSFDAKTGAYELAVPAEQYELAKDVAAFANSGVEGSIVCGLRTRKVRQVDTVNEVTPVPLEGIRPQNWLRTIRRLIVPSPEGLQVQAVRSEPHAQTGFVLVSIPPQPSYLRPFLLVVGRRDDGKIVETDITVPIRLGTETEFADAASIHSLLTAGRVALGDGEKKRSD
jgi:hypothetical protein